MISINPVLIDVPKYQHSVLRFVLYVNVLFNID